MNTIKYCKDCRHFLPAMNHGGDKANQNEFALCGHAPTPTPAVHMIDGRDYKRFEYCTVQRTDFDTLDHCGSSAKYFEAKPTPAPHHD